MVRFSVFALALVGCGTLVLATPQSYGYGSGPGYENPPPVTSASTSKSSSAPKGATPSSAGSEATAPANTPKNPSSGVATGGTATGDFKCADAMCIGATVKGDTIEYVMQPVPGQQAGWMAMGFGSQMVGPPMVVMWVNPDKTITLSNRQAKSHSLPAYVPNPQRVPTTSQNLSAPTDPLPKLAFTIPTDSQKQPSLIWAIGLDQPSSSNPSTATFKQHSSMGTITLDLTKSNDASVLLSPATSLSSNGGNNSTSAGGPASGGSTPTGTPANAQQKSAARGERVNVAHAILCAFAFLVLLM